MKAKYKAGRPEDNLTVGKKYDIEDVRCKKGFEASEVYLKNDKQRNAGTAWNFSQCTQNQRCR